jgi:hypothetical protein
VPHASGPAMFKQILILLFVLLIGGCSATPPPVGMFAWDGLGRDPNLPLPRKKSFVSKSAVEGNVKREKMLATMRPYSEAWWAIHDEIEAANDREIAAKLIICRGCFERTPSQDITVPGPARSMLSPTLGRRSASLLNGQ